MNRRTFCVISLGSVVWSLGFGNSAVAQQPQYLRIARLEEWVAAVEQHRPGEDDAPLRELASWSSADLDRVLVALTGLPQRLLDFDATFFQPPPPAGFESRAMASILYHPSDQEAFRRVARDVARRGDFNRLVKRGAFLHGDIEMRDTGRLPPDGGRPDAARGATAYFTDGRQLAFQSSVNHWGVARRLLDRVLRDPSRVTVLDPASDADVRQWYQATAAFMLQRQLVNPSHFDRALQLFPRDADVLFLTASLHEWLARPSVQDALQGVRWPAEISVEIAPPREELERAESLFRRALAANAGHVEARVRRGRVLAQMGRREQAETELRAALTGSADSSLRYYAHLFLGDVLEAQTRMDAARAQYEAALALFPRAQSAALALSRVALHTGDRGAATAAVSGPLAADASTSDDPWWGYVQAAGRDANLRLARLYAAFVEENRR